MPRDIFHEIQPMIGGKCNHHECDSARELFPIVDERMKLRALVTSQHTLEKFCKGNKLPNRIRKAIEEESARLGEEIKALIRQQKLKYDNSIAKKYLSKPEELCAWVKEQLKALDEKETAIENALSLELPINIKKGIIEVTAHARNTDILALKAIAVDRETPQPARIALLEAIVEVERESGKSTNAIMERLADEKVRGALRIINFDSLSKQSRDVDLVMEIVGREAPESESFRNISRIAEELHEEFARQKPLVEKEMDAFKGDENQEMSLGEIMDKKTSVFVREEALQQILLKRAELARSVDIEGFLNALIRSGIIPQGGGSS